MPRLAALAQRLATLGADWQTTDRRQQWTDEALAAQGALICYTHAVLDAARQDLQDTVAGRPPSAAGQYAETLSIIEAVDRRFKGLWGTVDLPIIHSFFAAAVAGE